MWVAVTFAYLIPAVLITTDLLSTDGVHFEQLAPSTSCSPSAAELRGSEIEVP
jgi:hypothetical protein